MSDQFDKFNDQLDGDEWRYVTIPYNGHGKMNIGEVEKAGLMCMADGEDISALEIIELLIESYKKSGGKSKGKIYISFTLDTCHAAGQYLHVRNALQRGEIEGSECLGGI